jgi:AmiR/NasT family two-component response regulator
VVMADMATAFLINASTHRQQVELAEQLQGALDARVVIEQAKGMIAAKRGITPDAAFDQIRRHARGRGAAVRAVAEAVVHLGLDLGTTEP